MAEHSYNQAIKQKADFSGNIFVNKIGETTKIRCEAKPLQEEKEIVTAQVGIKRGRGRIKGSKNH